MRHSKTARRIALSTRSGSASPFQGRHKTPFRAIAPPIVLFLAIQSCAGAQGGHARTPNMTSPRHAQMTVRNDHRHAVSVTLLQSATVYHVGNVDVTSLRTFRLPQIFNGMGVQVLVECRRTGDLFTSHEIAWAAQQEVELQIGPYVNLSKLSLR